MKTCTRCKETKLFDFFYKTIRSPDGHQPACKDCMATAYNNSRNKKIDHYRAVQSARSKNNKIIIDEWKQGMGCANCNENDPCCLDLHHNDPSVKDDHPSNLAKVSVKSFMEEAKKCTVLCANCHRKVHAGKINLRFA